MTKYLVWCPERGEGPDDAVEIEASDPIDAAEIWAQKSDYESAEYLIAREESSPTVVVRAPDGTETQWDLEAESVPHYLARPHREKKGKVTS